MGQYHAISNHSFLSGYHHTRSTTLFTQKQKIPLKTIKIRYKSEEKLLTIEDNFLTCGWLLSESIRLFPEACPIVGLRCVDRIDVIDVWLQDFERSVNIIKDSTMLTPIIGQSIEKSLSLGWFNPISVIGKGGFSNVFLVRKKDNGYLYALKVMQKAHIIKENKVKQALSECAILKKLRHPFVIQLRWAFQTSLELLMVTDFCPGGELFFHLHNLGRFTEEQARFYFSEILLAIEYLHKEKIIFRDLKPENTLIDLDGHVKLIDFGLAKEDKGDRQHSFCGSHEYLSPEMIKRTGYNKNIDFYSLGSFLFEMLTGLPPFWDKDREKLYYKILNEEIRIPKYLSVEVQSLLRGLLRKDPTLRLGSILGIREIKDHPWLANVDWNDLYQKKIVPPFRPNSSKSNFETEHLSANVKDPVFNNLEFYDPKNDPVFDEFFYIDSEKTKNHELICNYEVVEEKYDRSKSFIEPKIKNKVKNSYNSTLANRKMNNSVASTSQSPEKQRKKLGPELLSVKVNPKFVKNSNDKSKKKIRKPAINICNKSYVNMRHSLNSSKLGMD